jgi:hypothetical protein
MKNISTSQNKTLLIRNILFWLLLFASSGVNAADYYWRAVAANNNFNNIANWETAPGNGISPSVAPTPNDDVHFVVASNFTTINAVGNANLRSLICTSPVLYKINTGVF